MLLDTGATKTIVRPKIVKSSTKLAPTNWKLRTATGEAATVHGELDVILVIGNTKFKHRALVAEIEDDVIIGMDVMNSKGFELNFQRGILRVDGVEVVLHRTRTESIGVLLAEDTSIPERSEIILNACLDESGQGGIMMFEPRVHDRDIGRGIVVAKTLLHANEVVPVRVMNVNDYSVDLKKGIILGHCSSVSSIVRQVQVENTAGKQLTEELTTLLRTSSKDLSSEQRKMLRNLVNKHQDVFD